MVQQIILILILTKNDLFMDNVSLVASMQNLPWANWRYFTGSLSRGSAPRVYEYSCLCLSQSPGPRLSLSLFDWISCCPTLQEKGVLGSLRSYSNMWNSLLAQPEDSGRNSKLISNYFNLLNIFNCIVG